MCCRRYGASEVAEGLKLARRSPEAHISYSPPHSLSVAVHSTARDFTSLAGNVA